ncbi:MAG: primosomal protein N' [Clostridiales Family XIII bacterium]|jgi:primosomal protein N' (replication factor Y)|nr:primosomal protein N' [Clostridiales Family XIII bacterium]
MKYVDVIIETKSDNVDDFFTYKAEQDDIRVGTRVEVPFSGSKSKSGTVFAVHDELPPGLEGKRILKVKSVDGQLSISEESVKVAAWMRRRYFCRYTDAIASFLPPGTKPKVAAVTAEPVIAVQSSPAPVPAIPVMTDEQQAAFGVIKAAVEEGAPAAFLVHGVTGSGKTELYMRLASQVLAGGRRVIMLVPEINLTPQIIERFTDRFGAERLAVLHSKLTNNERYFEWLRIKDGGADIIIGARSAVFAPADDIGLIIIDEEHETTYKSDTAPKYDTIEVALKRSRAANAVCVLGSATPSVVSMYRAKSGLYRLVTLKKRYNETPLPHISIVDMRDELMQGNRSIFSSALHKGIENGLDAGKQTILFLNRRGYSPFISCRSCGYVMRCPQCGISMTYHKGRDRAVCHFCGHCAQIPKTCPECGSSYLKHFGVGTEKVEELSAAAFPEAKVARLDLDAASKKGSGAKILKDFEKGKTDILIGTQMVAKGLDFANVNPVGVIAADVSLNIPDFRSCERTYQLVTQVAGRAGRGDEQGEVYVQTYMPDNYAIEAAAKGDYYGLYETEILIRRTLSYPPYSDIYQITVYAAEEKDSQRGAGEVRAAFMKTMRSEHRFILGPQKSALAKVGTDYRYCLYIKALPEKRRHWEQALADIKKKINTDSTSKYRIMIDVNPFSLI